LRTPRKTLEHVDRDAIHRLDRLETVVVRQIVADEDGHAPFERFTLHQSIDRARFGDRAWPQLDRHLYVSRKRPELFLQSIGAKETKIEEAETGWWLGTYDKQTKPFEHKETAALA
jgi:hypothetical protein